MDNEYFKKRINMDRLENIRKLHPKIIHVVTNKFNDNLDTKDINNHLHKNIEVVIDLLNSFFNADMLKHDYDILYLSVLHLIDSMALIEENKIKDDMEKMKELFDFMMGGFGGK